MTSDPNELQAALRRLIDGSASEADRDVLRTALNAGVLVTGERAVAIGGNASDVIITTGNQNIVLSFKGADAATVLTALTSIAPTRLHEAPRPPADFTGREDELRELLGAIEQGSVTISGLQGMGGIGKTALAFKLVELLQPRYPDASSFSISRARARNRSPWLRRWPTSFALITPLPNSLIVKASCVDSISPCSRANARCY